MEFKNLPPDWENEGVEPTEEIKKKGFIAGYKPPAAYFNWFWNKTGVCIKELQDKLKAITKADVGLDKVENKTVIEIISEIPEATQEEAGLMSTQDKAKLDNIGDFNIIQKSLTIPNTGWTAEVNGPYTQKLVLSVKGITPSSIVNVTIGIESEEVAQDCGLSSTNESGEGTITFYAESVPSTAIQATYYVLEGGGEIG